MQASGARSAAESRAVHHTSCVVVHPPSQAAAGGECSAEQLTTAHPTPTPQADGSLGLYPPLGPLLATFHSSGGKSSCHNPHVVPAPIETRMPFLWAIGRASFEQQAASAGDSASLPPASPRQVPPLTLRVAWAVDLGKCVDASPLLACYQTPESREVTGFVGSHAGRLAAIDLRSGSVRWSTSLPDRLEVHSPSISSAPRRDSSHPSDTCSSLLPSPTSLSSWTHCAFHSIHAVTLPPHSAYRCVSLRAPILT